MGEATGARTCNLKAFVSIELWDLSLMVRGRRRTDRQSVQLLLFLKTGKKNIYKIPRDVNRTRCVLQGETSLTISELFKSSWK